MCIRDRVNAIKFGEKALDTLQRLRGENHEETAVAYHSLAYYCFAGNQTEKAFEMEKKALEIREKIFEGGHPYIRLSIECLEHYREAANEENNPLGCESLLAHSSFRV
eukprot:TRINITY_DN17024_c0_g1_i1.p2 TRINITY_DN17024_c0_g1~~TRINITY_DN17024_c0_g1_i1.p2  ORF type:complete len:119 (+),score=13.19 TRINITY_DN17024_c0_g1_i1:34-357(+)